MNVNSLIELVSLLNIIHRSILLVKIICYWLIILENEAVEIDKKTVLDLCAHMFHPKDNTTENSDTMELNELKTEDRIKEYENEQGELIFECFQDEVS